MKHQNSSIPNKVCSGWPDASDTQFDDSVCNAVQGARVCLILATIAYFVCALGAFVRYKWPEEEYWPVRSIISFLIATTCCMIGWVVWEASGAHNELEKALQRQVQMPSRVCGLSLAPNLQHSHPTPGLLGVLPTSLQLTEHSPFLYARYISPFIFLSV